jgi:hypothetical protein
MVNILEELTMAGAGTGTGTGTMGGAGMEWEWKPHTPHAKKKNWEEQGAYCNRFCE